MKTNLNSIGGNILQKHFLSLEKHIYLHKHCNIL